MTFKLPSALLARPVATRLRRLLTAALALSLGLSGVAAQAAATAALPAGVAQALQAGKLQPSALSLVAIPLDGPGQAILHNADVSVNPASTMKLITTYAALELLGPTYQWRTEFYTDGPLRNGTLKGNLYLKGGGDPKLNMERLWLLMRDLRSNGVQHVTGDLVLDRSYFNQPALPAFDDDGGDDDRPFLVTPDALLVNLKAMRFIARNDDGVPQVTVEPPIETIRIENRLKSLKPGRCPDAPNVVYHQTQDATDLTVTATGELAQGCSAQTYLSLLDHEAYAAGTVRALWKELGGTIDGGDRAGNVPQQARLLARGYSADLAEIIRDINKYSNNTMARQLFLSLGEHFRSDADSDDAKAAQRVIRAWLARKGITASHLVMENGSGLSRDERVSAREMAAILQAAWRSPYAAEYLSSLPLAGMDGTMRKRLKNTPVMGGAHVKTGTLNNVRALAGFTRDSNDTTWVVVAIINDPRPWGASSILDQVLLDLYHQPKRAEATAQR